MKKPGSDKRPVKKAPKAAKGGFLDLDDEILLQMLAKSLAGGTDFGGAPRQNLSERFKALLAACADQGLSEDSALIDDWVMALEEARIDANGGEPGARAALDELEGAMRQAIEDNSLIPPDMMIVGKTFAEAGLPPPPALKAGMARFFDKDVLDKDVLDKGVSDKGSLDPHAFASELTKDFAWEGDAFDVYEAVRGLTYVFPAAVKIAMLAELVDHPLASQAIAGFLFDPEPEVAAGAARLLADSAKRTPVERVALERLELIRSWLPPERQAGVDEALAEMRRDALPAQMPEPAKLLQCLASVCDGSGAMQVCAAQKSGKVYRLAAVLIKSHGIADAFIVESTRKRDIDGMLSSISEATASAQIDLATFARLVRLGLADNLASGALPPFKTAQVVEALQLGPLAPQVWSAEDLCRDLLAEVAKKEKDADALGNAHAAVLLHEATQDWFEAGAPVAALLAPLAGKQKRIKAMLEHHLPDRRGFWARQCARSALVLRAERRRLDRGWRVLALVGADLAAGRPIEDVPLMKKIAELSVQAFQT